jgi:hypothetical protein
MAWAEVLPVGRDSWGLVLPEDAGGIAWLAPDDAPNTFALVQSVLLDPDALSLHRYGFEEAVQDQGGWTALHDNLFIRNDDLLLMPAASRGDEVREVAWNRAAQIDTAQVIRVPTGFYSLDQYTLPGSEENEPGAIVTRFQRRPL